MNTVRDRAWIDARQIWGRLNPLIPGAKEFVEAIAKSYNLGIIANQPAECRETLHDFGLLHYFKILGFSEAVGLSKPDINFFKWAIQEAAIEPERCIMIGDRVDNDVKPAKSLGFKTIHFKQDVYEKIGDNHISDELKAYLPHVHQYNISMREPKDDYEVPHCTANSYSEIITCLDNLMAN